MRLRTALAVLLIAVALIAVAAVSGLAATPARAARLAQQSPSVTPPDCAWPWATNLDTLVKIPATNFSNPDVQSAYSIMDYTVQSGLRITLRGRFPDSRYMSFEVYSADGSEFTTNGVASNLTDYQIAPDPGSVNPWQQPAPPGGRYTVTLQSDVTPGQINTLPLAPAGTPDGTLGLLFFRVYVPAHDNPQQVPLPTVTTTLNGVSKQLTRCAPDTIPVPPVLSGSAGGGPVSGAPGELLPFSRFPVGTHTEDADIGQLEGGVIPPQNGDVLVIHGKAPTTPRGSSPSPWPTPREDLQYWSLCVDVDLPTVPVVVNQLPDGRVDYGCRYDSQTALDPAGYYTFVVGTESQRAAIDRIRGVTFVPFSTAYPTTAHILFFRNLVANPRFAEAVQNVPENESPASAEAVMKHYYPRAAVCPLTTLASRGVRACLKA